MNGLGKEFPFCSNPTANFMCARATRGSLGPAIGPRWPTAESSVAAFTAGSTYAIYADANGALFRQLAHELRCTL